MIGERKLNAGENADHLTTILPLPAGAGEGGRRPGEGCGAKNMFGRGEGESRPHGAARIPCELRKVKKPAKSMKPPRILRPISNFLPASRVVEAGVLGWTFGPQPRHLVGRHWRRD